MKIQLLCEHCSQPLTDKFSARTVDVVVGTYNLEMECVNCDNYQDIKLTLETTPKYQED